MDILVVVDMQNDFIDGALGTEEAQAIVGNVRAKIESYDPECVYVTMDTHSEDYSDTREGRFLPVPHCVKGTEGWELSDKLKDVLAGAKVFEKPSFGSVELAECLKEKYGKDFPDGKGLSVELIGLCTDICVVSNAMLIKAFLPEADLKVDSACCAGVTPDSHEAALETMKACQIEIA